MPCDLRIGTSGWHYAHWKGNFYPDKLPASKMLDHYVEHFDSVELNNSFYRLPAAETFTQWRRATPKNFVFAVKGSRYLTHMKKLKEPEEGIRRLFDSAERLGKKLGPVLFQLPPRWKVNVERLEAFLSALPRRHRYALELREQSWFSDEVYEVLHRHNAALCIYELAGFKSPIELTADFTYVRLHGPTENKYQGSYSSRALDFWVRKIRDWRRQLRAVYVYFDNDQAGYAAQNALELSRRVGTIDPAVAAGGPPLRSG